MDVCLLILNSVSYPHVRCCTTQSKDIDVPKTPAKCCFGDIMCFDTKARITRSSADSDNRLDAFSGSRGQQTWYHSTCYI